MSHQIWTPTVASTEVTYPSTLNACIYHFLSKNEISLWKKTQWISKVIRNDSLNQSHSHHSYLPKMHSTRICAPNRKWNITEVFISLWSQHSPKSWPLKVTFNSMMWSVSPVNLSRQLCLEDFNLRLDFRILSKRISMIFHLFADISSQNSHS